MKVSIFGIGYVGVVSASCLAEQGHEIVAVDIDPEKIKLINSGLSPIVEPLINQLIEKSVAAGRLRATSDAETAIFETNVSIISVGTPSDRNGALSTDALRNVTIEIGQALKTKASTHTVIYRSTMLPGTMSDIIIPLLNETAGKAAVNNLNICFNPEFLREGSSVRDFKEPPFTIAGSTTIEGYEIIEKLYECVDAPFFRIPIKTAESIKYISNLYHALKITFANEIGVMLKDIGIDSREAMDIFCKDQQLNISNAYLRPGYAFGGSCLPKDLRAFLYLSRSRGIELPMLRNIETSNSQHVERAFKMVEYSGKRNVTLIGLSFKPGTDDLRESPLMTLAERMIGRGYELKIYDPWINTSRLLGANLDYFKTEIPYLDERLESSLEGAISGSDIAIFGHASDEVVRDFLKLSPTVSVIDLQGIELVEESYGKNYQGICW